MDCAEEDSGATTDRVLWFNTGIRVYNAVDVVEEYAATVVSQF